MPLCAATPESAVSARARSRNIGWLNISSVPPASLLICAPGLGPGPQKFTSRSGSFTGNGRSSICSNNEKMAALAPMPRAIESTATAVMKGVLKSVRNASFRLRITRTSMDRWPVEDRLRMDGIEPALAQLLLVVQALRAALVFDGAAVEEP